MNMILKCINLFWSNKFFGNNQKSNRKIPLGFVDHSCSTISWIFVVNTIVLLYCILLFDNKNKLKFMESYEGFPAGFYGFIEVSHYLYIAVHV